MKHTQFGPETHTQYFPNKSIILQLTSAKTGNFLAVERIFCSTILAFQRISLFLEKKAANKSNVESLA